MVSIIILVHNAPLYVFHTLKTLKFTKGVDYEVIVLDNKSNNFTKEILIRLHNKGYIDKLIFEKENILFAKGNNTAALLCDKNSKFILLLNSDVEIRDEEWLKLLLEKHKRGAIAYGLCIDNPWTRGDGYCFLIDKDLYLKYGLDERFEWFWSVTKLQAQLLNDGYNVTAIQNHEKLIHHYGGKSGTSWQSSDGMDTEMGIIKKWFNKKNIIILESLDGRKPIYKKYSIVNLISKLKSMLKVLLIN